ncbi:MAG: hypothetical protein L0Z53_19090 [Acidobacteriales bacterium]|nr:hypothetical protein [Terriglobales bacterium]
MSPIIFLDIDGVLNGFEGGPSTIPRNKSELSQECIGHFNRIIEATDAQIVITSYWRYYITGGHFSIFGFATLLRSHGVLGQLIGHTRDDKELPQDEREPRWTQIADWLHDNPGHGRYCILDDRADAFGGRPGVQTNGSIGLTEKDASQAIEILNA